MLSNELVIASLVQKMRIILSSFCHDPALLALIVQNRNESRVRGHSQSTQTNFPNLYTPLSLLVDHFFTNTYLVKQTFGLPLPPYLWSTQKMNNPNLKFYILDFQNHSNYPKQKDFLKSYQGNLEIIQFILSDEYLDRP